MKLNIFALVNLNHNSGIIFKVQVVFLPMRPAAVLVTVSGANNSGTATCLKYIPHLIHALYHGFSKARHMMNTVCNLLDLKSGI